MQGKISLLITMITLTTALELPSSFKICQKADPKFKQCFQEAVKIALLSMANGIADLEVPHIDPLYINKIKIGDDQQSISLRQIYSNITFYGITSNLQINTEIVDLDKLLFVITSKSSIMNFVGNYKLEGKILLFSIYGEGKCNISLYEVTLRHEIHLEKYKKNGETYVKIVKYFVKTIPTRVKFQYDNLLNGNVLGSEILQLLNKNALMIYEEYDKYFSQAFAMIYTQIGNKIFSRVPYDKIFP